ncbi:hypothetical protein CD178_00476 [Komagataeibacter saccharivorans]|uniref:Uncharacterized protein n=1 Tax=Komagataeibacter saccharivorans TaxID=265959 RepID=A0A347W8V1_9PROT|nr:hypothetical protein [Komagataeibacter saccharivorans]AXY21294.1 hypothetical protein CD178_00476 [Komagataeibacter saccharivorans]
MISGQAVSNGFYDASESVLNISTRNMSWVQGGNEQPFMVLLQPDLVHAVAGNPPSFGRMMTDLIPSETDQDDACRMLSGVG